MSCLLPPHPAILPPRPDSGGVLGFRVDLTSNYIPAQIELGKRVYVYDVAFLSTRQRTEQLVTKFQGETFFFCRLKYLFVTRFQGKTFFLFYEL